MKKAIPNALKIGKVLIIGRPNVGKSTLINNLIGQKVAITSPKPQTTRFPIKAVYEDERGKIIFVDTPGIFGKAEDFLAKKINKKTLKIVHEAVDLVLYMVDHTRRRDFEEAKVLGIVRKIDRPKILVINKIDLEKPEFLPQYKFLEDEFSHVFQVSAITKKNFRLLLDKIFELLKEKSVSDETWETEEKLVYPVLNIDSRIFLAELIREKVFLKTGEEIPYTTTVVVDDVKERSKNLTYIKARVLTTNDRYKKMLIGKKGQKIKEIGSMARREIELATAKKIYLDLTVETNPHWQETFYS